MWGLSNVPASLHSNHSNRGKKGRAQRVPFLVSTRTDVPESKSVIKLGRQGYPICLRACVRDFVLQVVVYRPVCIGLSLGGWTLKVMDQKCQRHHGCWDLDRVCGPWFQEDPRVAVGWNRNPIQSPGGRSPAFQVPSYCGRGPGDLA